MSVGLSTTCTKAKNFNADKLLLACGLFLFIVRQDPVNVGLAKMRREEAYSAAALRTKTALRFLQELENEGFFKELYGK